MIAMILSLIIIILSDSRPLVEVEINGRPAVMLIDTGSRYGIIDEGQLMDYGLEKRKLMERSVIGVGKKEKPACHISNFFIDVHGVRLHQFIAVDISNIVESIQEDTGYTIVGIIGYDQIVSSEMKIHLDNKYIKIGY